MKLPEEAMNAISGQLCLDCHYLGTASFLAKCAREARRSSQSLLLFDLYWGIALLKV